MKKFIAVSLLLASVLVSPTTALAAANDARILQSDPTNSFQYINYVPAPAFGAYNLIAMDGSTTSTPFGGNRIFGMNFGTEFSVASDTLSVANLPQTNVTGLTSALNGKFNTPAGTTSQYVRGDGSLATLPTSSSPTFATSSRSIVTGTGATGFQVSATQNATVNYAVNIRTVASIAGSADGYVTLEVAPTNSATASDWYEVGSRCRNGQTLTLAVALQITQDIGCNLSGMVPAGYYVKLRSVNVSGTPTYTFNSGHEMKF